MFDPAKFLLFLVILELTVILVVLGIQVFLILRDLRQTISKANKVLDNTNDITQSVSRPISSLSGVLMGLKNGAKFANFLKKIEEKPLQGKEKNGK